MQILETQLERTCCRATKLHGYTGLSCIVVPEQSDVCERWQGHIISDQDRCLLVATKNKRLSFACHLFGDGGTSSPGGPPMQYFAIILSKQDELECIAVGTNEIPSAPLAVWEADGINDAL